MLNNNDNVLEGIKILDFTRVIAGTFCTMYMADLGAEVIKVELPEFGEVMRVQPPVKNGESGFFVTLNRGKKSIALDLKAEKAKEIIYKLVEKVDIVVENFKPGVMKKLGFDYDTLKQYNPKLICGSISGYGQTGPLSDLPSYDLCIQAMCGLMSMNGYPDKPPLRIGNSITDYMSGVLMVVAVLGALRHKDKTGEGQYIDISMYDAGMTMLENSISRYNLTGEIGGLIGSHHPSASPHCVYRTADGFVTIIVIEDNAWKRLTRIIGRPELADDPKFSTIVERLSRVPEVDDIVEGWSKTKTSAEIMAIFKEEGLACGTVFNVAEVSNSNHAQARGMLVEVQQPQMGPVKIPGCPINFSKTPVEVKNPAPLVGEHTKEILCGFLEYTEEEYQKLKDDNIV
jgi:crotonobetainyl-CoA:carnitine CoA-transferase CaiB-like acyl-CoA transferase